MNICWTSTCTHGKVSASEILKEIDRSETEGYYSEKIPRNAALTGNLFIFREKII